MTSTCKIKPPSSSVYIHSLCYLLSQSYFIIIYQPHATTRVSKKYSSHISHFPDRSRREGDGAARPAGRPDLSHRCDVLRWTALGEVVQRKRSRRSGFRRRCCRERGGPIQRTVSARQAHILHNTQYAPVHHFRERASDNLLVCFGDVFKRKIWHIYAMCSTSAPAFARASCAVRNFRPGYNLNWNLHILLGSNLLWGTSVCVRHPVR